MKFRYSARTKTGEMQVGYVEGINQEAALDNLHSHELYVLSIKGERAPGFLDRLTKFFNRVKRQDLMVFTRQFATMLEAAIPLGDTLKALYRQTYNLILREAVFEISTDIDTGLSLSQALERQAHIFSEFYINLIKSAEVTGQVDEAMGFLANYLEKEVILVNKVRNAMIYPIFVIVLFVITAGVLMGVVFPQIEPIFAESQVELPFITRLFLIMGNFIANWWLALIIVMAIVIILIVDYFRSQEGRVVWDQLVLATPVFGRLLRQTYVARFAEGATVLIKGGIPVAQAIEIASHTIGSGIYQDVLHQAADKVRQGQLLSRALEEEEYYLPPLVSQMVAIGEKTGRLDEMFSRIAQFYTREVDDLVSNLVELIQPALMVLIGAMVGLLFASILLPIYNLVQVF